MTRTGERIIPEQALQSKEAYLIYLKHFFAYELVKQFIPENSIALEVGCGEGYGTSYLSQHVQHIVGADIDPWVIQHASNKYGSALCSFNITDGVRLSYRNNTYDAVVSFQVIEHIRDEMLFLTEISRVLKPHGICILTTPNKIYRVQPGKKPWNRFHLREYAPDELENMLKKIFSDVQVWGIQGSAEVQQVEKARLKQVQRFVALDPLNLRRFMPPSVESLLVAFLKRVLKRRHNTQNKKNFLFNYSTKNYFIIKDDVEESLDLLAICKK